MRHFPVVMPVVIINPDNTTMELGIKEEAAYPGCPGSGAYSGKEASEADAVAGKPRGPFAGRFDICPGSAVPRYSFEKPQLYIQLAQAGIWLPDTEGEAGASDGEGSSSHSNGAGSSRAHSSSDGASSSWSSTSGSDDGAGSSAGADSYGTGRKAGDT